MKLGEVKCHVADRMAGRAKFEEALTLKMLCFHQGIAVLQLVLYGLQKLHQAPVLRSLFMDWKYC